MVEIHGGDIGSANSYAADAPYLTFSSSMEERILLLHKIFVLGLIKYACSSIKEQ